MASSIVHIRADSSAVDAGLDELSSAIEGPDGLPDSLRDEISALLADLDSEIAVDHCPAASSAGELVCRLYFAPGGRFEAAVAAVRAFRADRVHGGSLP